MSTDQEKSFTARLTYGKAGLRFKELALQGSFFANDAAADTKDSQYLCINEGVRVGALLYFKFVNGHYEMYSREPKEHYGKAVGISNGYLLATDTPMKFELISAYDRTVMTLDGISVEHYEALIKGPYGYLWYYKWVPVGATTYSYIVTHGGTIQISFMLHIEQRNVG